MNRAAEGRAAVGAAEVQLAKRLAVDAATAEIARALRGSGVRWLLLKGPVVARRLYRDGTPRPYGDVDVFPAPESFERAGSIVESLGYRREEQLARIQVEHGETWRRSSDYAAIDLHRTLPHLGVGAHEAWAAMAEDTEDMSVAGERVEISGLPAFALLMVLHALHHAPFGGKPLADLERAVAQIPEGEWRRARELAGELRAERNFAAGLRLTPSARALGRRLGLPEISRWEAKLRAGDVMRLSSTVKLMSDARGVREKIAILRREAIPPEKERPIFEKQYSSRSSTLIFLRRVGRLVGKSPLAVAAWYLERKDRRTR